MLNQQDWILRVKLKLVQRPLILIEVSAATQCRMMSACNNFLCLVAYGAVFQALKFRGAQKKISQC